jgi:hypothetical protein
MKILATLLLAAFCAVSLPAAVPPLHMSPQVRSYQNGKRAHRAKHHHRGRKHRRA